MSDTAMNDSLPTIPDPAFALDGDAPRLGAPTMTAPKPVVASEVPNLPSPTPLAPTNDAPNLPTPTPLAPTNDAPNLPTPTPLAPTGEVADLPLVSPVLTSADAPTLPAGTPNHAPMSTESNDEAADADESGEPRHPMAHLMPQKSKPTEASVRAAEIRAAQKTKGKKIKIGIAVGSLVFTALVGPPLFKWLSNAINEAGDTSTEQTTD